jgi:hypothetical protein
MIRMLSFKAIVGKFLNGAHRDFEGTGGIDS